MKTSIKIIGTILLFLITTSSVFAQKGWTQKITENKLSYVPTDLHSGKTFTFYTYHPEELNRENPKDFLLNRAKTLQSSFGTPTGKWKFTTEKDGSPSLSINYTSKSGKSMTNGYVLCNFDEKRVFVTQMVSNAEIGLLLKYALRYEEVTNTSKAYYSKNQGTSHYGETVSVSTKENNSKKRTTTSIDHVEKTMLPNGDVSLERLAKMTGKARGKYIREKIRVAPNTGLKLSQIEKIWFDSGYNVITGKIQPDVYVLLKDGTIYKDLRIPTNELDVVASKRLEGNTPYAKRSDWSTWKKSGNGYQIKDEKSGEWKPLEGNAPHFVPKGTKLNQKFISASGSQWSGASKKYITFFADGRFEMSSSFINDNSSIAGNSGPYVGVVGSSDKNGSRGVSVIAGSSVGGGSKSVKNDGNKNTGSYEINKGYILLQHDNGYVHTELFLFVNAKKDKFVLGNKVFWIPKREKP